MNTWWTSPRRSGVRDCSPTSSAFRHRRGPASSSISMCWAHFAPSLRVYHLPVRIHLGPPLAGRGQLAAGACGMFDVSPLGLVTKRVGDMNIAEVVGRTRG